jgi:hypothetical protein
MLAAAAKRVRTAEPSARRPASQREDITTQALLKDQRRRAADLQDLYRPRS